jgi:DNA-binding MarR family transcriptional regulator
VSHSRDDDLHELRRALRALMRGLWSRRRPTPELIGLVRGEPPLGRRHVAMLAQVATGTGQTVGELARTLGLSLPAASKVTTELESHRLVARSEDPADRRRTVVELEPSTAAGVREWLARRDRPLEQALASLTVDERAAFLKGLRALADALLEESPRGPLRSHHRAAHRRRPHRDRPV